MLTLGCASIVNQLTYLLLVVMFYLVRVHFVQHQVQIDTHLVTSALERHRTVFTDKRTLGIILTKEAMESGLTLDQANVALGTFPNKASALLKLEAPVGVIVDVTAGKVTQTATQGSDTEILPQSGSSQDLSSYQFRIYLRPIGPRENAAPALVHSKSRVYEFELRYRVISDIQRLLDQDTLPLVELILNPQLITPAKSFKHVHLKLMFLVGDKEDRELVRRGVTALQTDKQIIQSIKSDLRKISGPSVQVHVSYVFDVKNTLNPMINMMNPNQEVLKPRLQKLIEDFDYERSESTETQALNVLIEVGSRPISANKKFTTYRHSVYVKTSEKDIVTDLQKATRYLSLEVFGLSQLVQKLSETTGRRNHEETLNFAQKLKHRRILALSLNALETVEYINSNLNFRIKDSQLPKITDFLQKGHATAIQTNNLAVLDDFSSLREQNFFETTYIFEQYVYGLMALVFISSVSPLLKVVKEYLFGWMFSFICPKKNTDKQTNNKADVSLLSVLEWLFEKDLIALDDKDMESDCEDTDPPQTEPQTEAPADIKEDKKER